MQLKNPSSLRTPFNTGFRTVFSVLTLTGCPVIGSAQAAESCGCAAHALDDEQHQQLAVQVLARTQPVTKLAERHGVSRKFVYHQADNPVVRSVSRNVEP